MYFMCGKILPREAKLNQYIMQGTVGKLSGRGDFFVLDRFPIMHIGCENILRCFHNLKYPTSLIQWNFSSLKTYHKQQLFLLKL